jgi:hypothetical protein
MGGPFLYGAILTLLLCWFLGVTTQASLTGASRWLAPHATGVGEPTGERPNHHDQVRKQSYSTTARRKPS